MMRISHRISHSLIFIFEIKVPESKNKYLRRGQLLIIQIDEKRKNLKKFWVLFQQYAQLLFGQKNSRWGDDDIFILIGYFFFLLFFQLFSKFIYLSNLRDRVK